MKRMVFCAKRKKLLVKNLRKEKNILSNKARFVEEVCSGDLVVNDRKKIVLPEDLQSRGCDRFDKAKSNDVNDDSDDESEDSTSAAGLSRGHEHLLEMKSLASANFLSLFFECYLLMLTGPCFFCI